MYARFLSRSPRSWRARTSMFVNLPRVASTSIDPTTNMRRYLSLRISEFGFEEPVDSTQGGTPVMAEGLPTDPQSLELFETILRDPMKGISLFHTCEKHALNDCLTAPATGVSPPVIVVLLSATRRSNRRVELLDVLVRTRLKDLNVASRATLIRALQEEGLRRSTLRAYSIKAISSILLGTRGIELTQLKEAIHRGGGRHDLQKLVFFDITNKELRMQLLQHFAIQAIMPVTRHPIHVISDFDDTVQLNWLDRRFPRGTVYPGVAAFLHCLTSTHPSEYTPPTGYSREEFNDLMRNDRAPPLSGDFEPPATTTSASISWENTEEFFREEDGAVNDSESEVGEGAEKGGGTAADEALEKSSWFRAKFSKPRGLPTKLRGRWWERFTGKRSTENLAVEGGVVADGESRVEESDSDMDSPPAIEGDDALNEVSPLEVEALREKLAGLQHPVNVSSSPPEMPSSVVSSEGGLMLVTARPSGVRDMVKRRTLNKALHLGFKNVTVSAGSLLRSTSTAAIVQKKFENVHQLALLFPEFSFVFLGDSGQGDAAVADLVLEHLRGQALAALIHDVKLGDSTGDGRPKHYYQSQGVHFFESYIEAARYCHSLGLLARDSVLGVAAEALNDFERIQFKATNKGKQKRRKALQTLSQDLERLRVQLGNKQH